MSKVAIRRVLKAGTYYQYEIPNSFMEKARSFDPKKEPLIPWLEEFGLRFNDNYFIHEGFNWDGMYPDIGTKSNGLIVGAYSINKGSLHIGSMLPEFSHEIAHFIESSPSQVEMIDFGLFTRNIPHKMVLREFFAIGIGLNIKHIKHINNHTDCITRDRVYNKIELFSKMDVIENTPYSLDQKTEIFSMYEAGRSLSKSQIESRLYSNVKHLKKSGFLK